MKITFEEIWDLLSRNELADDTKITLENGFVKWRQLKSNKDVAWIEEEMCRKTISQLLSKLVAGREVETPYVLSCEEMRDIYNGYKCAMNNLQ